MNKVATARQRRFEELYGAYRPEILAYCIRRMERDEAADACSETFLVAWRRLDELPPPPATLAFLYGIARRVVSNNFRSVGRRVRLDARLAALGVPLAPDPLVLIAQDSHQQEVLAAVRRLNPRDREIVMLYAWEDLPRETIAEIMGLTRSAVDQRIHRANQRLARMLEPERGRAGYVI